HDVAEALEPEIGHFVQHPPLVRDRVGEHDVERGKAVARDDQHLVLADGVDIAHLAVAQARQALELRLVQGHAACLSSSFFHLPSAASEFMWARWWNAFCAAATLPACPFQVLSAGF